MTPHLSSITKPKGILVLGMHRSGTSALTRVLNLFGASLSTTLWPPDEANRRGFWEDPRIFGIHDALFTALGRSWDDVRAMPQNWLGTEAAADARRELVELLLAEFSGSPIWMVKDPRMCRLLPLWKQVFEQLGASMHCVLALRHPDEVAQSLASRNGHALAKARLAWLEHTAESVIGSTGHPRVVVSYDQLMTDWEAAVRRVASHLDIAWPIATETVRERVNDFLSADERHHQIVWPTAEKNPELTDRLYTGMLLASEEQGWDLAEEAAHMYVNSRVVFLEALDSKQGEFEMQRKEWIDEKKSLLDELETRQKRSEQLVGEFAATVEENLTRIVREQLAVHSESIEKQLTVSLIAQSEVAQDQLECTLDGYSKVLSDTLKDAAVRMDLLQAAVDDVKSVQVEVAALQESRRELSDEVRALRTSSSWRLTAPLRLAATMVRRPATVVYRFGALTSRVRFLAGLTRTSISQRGALRTGWRVLAAPWRHGLRNLFLDAPGVFTGQEHSANSESSITLPRALPAIDSLSLRVLLVAELGLPQCRQYRVVQKQQMLQKIGIESTVVSWTDVRKCRSLLQTHSVAIFYRVPGFPEQLKLMREAKVLGLATFWEVDDIIFDMQKYRANKNVDHLDEETRKGIWFGIPLYRAALVECGAGIASTRGVADAMLETGVRQVFVVENALDGEALRVAAGITEKKSEDGIVRIVYGSGSRAHDADFRVAAKAIRRVLRARPNARLTVIGELNLPISEYGRSISQVERFPITDYATYMGKLSSCDINIAPLEDTEFNDAKSNIKYLESAILRLPSVCSPRAAFRAAIQDGVNGFLPADENAWEQTLLALVDNAALRVSVAERAYDHVMAQYAMPRLAIEQLEPVVSSYRERRSPKLRVLGVNIFFAPRSFGGATIVAEEMMRCINKRDDVEYAMFTTLPTSDVPSYELVRYSAAGGNVFAMGLPHEGAPAYSYNNPHSVDPFIEVLESYAPDVVHLHSVQGIGARIAEACIKKQIPFTVTLHDAWWICERQFMVNSRGHYCHQRKIDLDVCASCVPDIKATRTRQDLLKNVLQSAARLFTPSKYFRQLYLDNGFDPERTLVNKNGVSAPSRAMERDAIDGRVLRFGFVGGAGPIKGAPLIQKALRSLKYDNYELHVVDNELNLGRHSINPEAWAIPGRLKIIPAYTRASIDDFFESIDVLLFPSQWKESFGLTVREALVRDVWVIATDAGGVVEDIVSGENGQIIPFGDTGGQLAAAIASLLENPARLNGYRNPYANQIRLFEQQAEEICEYFSDVVVSEC